MTSRFFNPASKRAALVCVAMMAVPASAQAAGLFDFLFGRPAQPVPPVYYRSEPLGVQVNPHRRRPPGFTSQSTGREAKAKLQTPIDSVRNPTWYLDDPTLRKGDIIVLRGKVIVYDGGRRERSMDDFTSLASSRLVSRSERDRVEKMAKGNASMAVAEPLSGQPAGAAKEASLR